MVDYFALGVMTYEFMLGKRAYNGKTKNDIKEISNPNFVKELSYKELDILSSEIRKEIVSSVSNNGGHLSSNLGVVEATIALCRSFDFDFDNIFGSGSGSFDYDFNSIDLDEFEELFSSGSGWNSNNFQQYFGSDYDQFMDMFGSMSDADIDAMMEEMLEEMRDSFGDIEKSQISEKIAATRQQTLSPAFNAPSVASW